MSVNYVDEKKPAAGLTGDQDSQELQHPRVVAGVDLGEEEEQIGVRRVEAAARVYGKGSIWFLYLGLAMASYVYSLDGTTTWTYLSWAQSSFGKHSLISSVQTAQQIIVAIGKPVVAKLADSTSRVTAYCWVLVFYVIGYIVIATANATPQLAAGIVVYSMGYTGLQVLTSIIVADITSLKWRGFVQGLTSSPFIINAFVSASISADILGADKSGWRWGYGMFAILVPFSLAPLIITLGWAERTAYKKGYIVKDSERFIDKWIRIFIDVDLLGLLFLSAGVALLLLPLTLANDAKNQWNNKSIIAMIVLGPIFLIVFAVYEWKFAPRPLAPLRFFKNKSFVGASLIGFFDFISFYLTFTYLYSFVYVTKTWSLRNSTYFANTQTVALTVFAIMAGAIMRYTHRYKWLLVAGLVIRLIGVGIMIHSRGANGSTAELVITQIIQGFGGGIAAVTTSVAAQASVTHKDVAIITALVLLITEIGGTIGTAIAGAIWSNTMPKQLLIHLPFLNDTARAKLFGSIITAGSFPIDHPIRVGTLAAYDEVMKTMLIADDSLYQSAVIPIGIALIMPNWYLGDKQNAVDDRDTAGEHTGDTKAI